MPSSSAWIRAGVAATVAPGSTLHDDTVAKVPVINRFMQIQKPPSSQISAFSFFRSRLRKMKQSPRYGSWPSSCSTTQLRLSMPRRMSCGSRATKIRRMDEKLSIHASARPAPSTAEHWPDQAGPPQ
jgi:hypothetical protein